MASKKIQDNIDTGLYNRHANGITASAFEDIGAEDGRYRLNFHEDNMPAHYSNMFSTLDELETGMRDWCPDLRKWHIRI